MEKSSRLSQSGRSVSVFGLGYVGSVTAACLAHKGARVIGVDVNPAKVEMVNSGRSPILEAQMDALVAEGRESSRLRATTDFKEAVRESELSFTCVGTPSRPNGQPDLSHLKRVCREIGEGVAAKRGGHAVVVRSTVLPGTTRRVVIPALEAASGRRAGADFTVICNPEFTREGTAVADFFDPAYTVLGAEDCRDLALVRELYDWAPGRVYETPLEVAEMIKYASNAFHALKVTFANEVACLAKQFGVDTEMLAEIFTADARLNISSAYLRPGFAFGGSCLPKDVRALAYRARELDLRLPLLEAILPSNGEHIERAVEAVLRTKKKRVGVLGLSFKAGTDDLRESPQVKLVKRLLGEGCEIQIWDRDVSLGRLAGSNRQFIEEVIPHIGSLLSNSLESVVAAAEVIVIGTRAVDREELGRYLRPQQVVVDLVNIEKARRPTESSYDGICW
ncbi:MAG TPA: UDP-glucose/GDP-mannose dehydrogenase family protein [Terriglobia bacterium]|nr:UDP-glucose/GDP-mannose dehydrogenase family protein [Terriglobia bacterium]